MKLPRRSAHIAAILFSLLLIFPSAAVVAQAPSGGWTLRLPSVQRDFVPNLQRVSRFGFGAAPIESIHVRAYPTYTLNAGWYLDWTSRRTPIRPGGISFVHVVGLSENGAPRPSGSARWRPWYEPTLGRCGSSATSLTRRRRMP